MSIDYRPKGITINNDCSSGPVNTRPGSKFLPGPSLSKCYSHPELPSVVVIQGETDSFGCEYIPLCSGCLNEHNNHSEPETLCEHCLNIKKTKPRRDPDEGTSGRLYDICDDCNKKMIDNFCDGEDDEFDQVNSNDIYHDIGSTPDDYLY